MKGSKKAYLYLIITFILWGSLYVVSKKVLGELPAFTISMIRFAIAFAVLGLLGRKKRVKIERQDYKYVAAIGVVGYFVAVGAQLLGTKYAGASMASLLNSLNPVTMSVFAAIFLKEKLTLQKIAGMILALIGVYIVLGGGNDAYSIPGILFSAVAVLAWSAISILVRKLTQKYPSLLVTRYGIGVAVFCYLPLSIWELVTHTQAVHLDMSGIVELVYMGAICTGVAYLLWNKSLEELPAGICSAFYPIQPLVSTLCGILFLRERITAAFVLGAACIVAGLWVSLINKKQRA